MIFTSCFIKGLMTHDSHYTSKLKHMKLSLIKKKKINMFFKMFFVAA